jgi:hypothetical protein
MNKITINTEGAQNLLHHLKPNKATGPDDIRVGKKVGNTHISQDGGKYWEIRLILNLQI